MDNNNKDKMRLSPKKYKKNSFGDRSNALESAEVIVPLVLELVQPGSIIDVGCGTGEFLSVFQKKGIQDIYGIDGPWVDKKRLCIPKNRFAQKNLEEPCNIDRRFDLAISLEVAEHLSIKSAKTFVKNLTDLSSLVLFSAAIPYQGGLHHINEQWPEYWSRLFRTRGYVPVDCMRKKIWKNPKVCFWYAQNMLLYAKEDYLKTNKKLQEEYEKTEHTALAIVHPKLYLQRARICNYFIKFVPHPISKWISRRFFK